jgi:hypothetical protein
LHWLVDWRWRRHSWRWLLCCRLRRKLCWQFVLISRRLEICEKALEIWREMNSELTRFNPIVLEFWKRVLFSSDEFVNLLVVKLSPEMLLLLRKMAEVEMFTAQKL